MMHGRSALSSMSTALITPSGSAPQRLDILALHSSGFGASSAAASMNTSNGTSSTTGPGGPVTMVFHALAHRERHHLAARRLEHPLAIGAHSRREVRLIVAVQFLEGAAIELTGRDVTGHRHEGYGVEEGVGERDRQVGRAGAARSKSRGRLAGHAIIHVGHKARDALVAHRDGLDVVLALVQSVDGY